MRSIIILFAALLCGNATYAQGAHVPPNIKAAFAQKYPVARKVKWDKEGDKYECSFRLNEKSISVLYDINGQIEETETAIAVSALPPEAKIYAVSKGHIKEAAKIVSSDGKVTYEAEVKGKDLIFDEMGNYLEAGSETKD